MENDTEPVVEMAPTVSKQQDKDKRTKMLQKGAADSRKGKRNEGMVSQLSGSEVTIYKRAVKLAGLNEQPEQPQVDKFIAQVRHESSEKQKRKVPSSDDKFMDTSDESVEHTHTAVAGINTQFFNTQDNVNRLGGDYFAEVEAGPSNDAHFATERSAEVQVDDLVCDAEKSRARMFEVPGKDMMGNAGHHPNMLHQHLESMINPFNSVAWIDEDYQMIDAHIDEVLKCKIQDFEFVDFSKLLSKNHYHRDDKQRLEIVNKQGMTYLAPMTDQGVNISSYAKWEQAFHMYSNVLTSKFPGKATELLQYNHTIHTVSTAYLWDNIYQYDKEFRYHISRHPSRSWAIILQQAWTMLLKDRIKNDNSIFNKGNFNARQGGGRKEICKCFNKGKCSYGLSYKYDHCCAVPKCGKFGHRLHICLLRDDDSKSGMGGKESVGNNQNNQESCK